MIDDKFIDYESEHNKAINKLAKLRQKYNELEEDRDYVKSLLDVEFEKRIKLQKENEELKKEAEEYNEDAMSYQTLYEQQLKKSEELHKKNQNTQAVLNDFINICNRLQANPHDEQALNVARDMLQNMNQELKE